MEKDSLVSDELVKSAWDDYWQQGHITSFGTQFKNNYTGAVATLWQNLFKTCSLTDKVLDVATGNGAVLELAKRTLAELPPENLVGIDYAQVKNANPNFTLLSEINVEHLPFEDNSFTLATSQYGIEYAKFEKSLPEIARILVPDGKFQFICHCENSVILENNRKIRQITQELLKADGALFILREMLAKLAQQSNEMNDNKQQTEALRNALNEELTRLHSIYGQLLHDTEITALLKQVLRVDKNYQEKLAIIKSYEDEQIIASTRLLDLENAALTQDKIAILSALAKQTGLGVIEVEPINETNVGLIGLKLSGKKHPSI